MRKFLLSTVALLIAVSMMAVGNNSGANQTNAIDFDWDGTYIHQANNTSWYSIKLSELNKEADDPTVALYLTNLTNELANVKLSGNAMLEFPYPISLVVGKIDLLQYAGNNATATYDIEGKKHVVWTMPTAYDLSGISDAKVRDALAQVFGDITNVSLIQLVEFGLGNVYLEVYSSKQIAIAADVYETSEIVDDACTKAIDFNWAGETVEPGETWFYLDLNEVKNSDKKLNFVVENLSALEANVTFDLFADCPASAILLDYDWTILAGTEVKEALGRFFLDQMTRDYVYLKLTTDQSVKLSAEEEVLPPPVELFNPSTAPVLEVGKEYVLNAETVFKLDLDALKAPKGYKTVCHIRNTNDEAVNLKQEIAFATPVTSNNVQEKNLLVASGATLDINVPNKQIESVKSDVAYFRLTVAKTLTLWMEHVKIETSTTTPSTPAILAPSCEDSYAFDWNTTIKQKALTTKWYELDIAPLKKNKEHVQLDFTNHSDSMVVVVGSIMLDCNSKDTIPLICPIPAGMQISKVLDYSLLAASPLEKVYVSITVVPTKVKELSELASIKSKEDLKGLVSLNLGAEIQLKATKSSALVDPTYCESTYQNLEKGKEYNLEAGVTKWYRVTDEFVKNDLGILEQLTIFNQGQKDANVTLGVTLDCKYGICTTINQKVPRWFDVTSYYPSGLFHLVDAIVADEITEFYLSITSDQPMLFGFDLDYGTMLGCDDAREFDWTNGAVIEKGDAQWLSFDISSVKQNKQQVRLTLTNESNSLAWVAMMVSLTCPFDVALPMIFPIPAGMSIDKVVDYSYFASTKLDQIYVALITEEKISLKAHAEKATASTQDKLACENAVEVKSGELYKHNASRWYKFSGELFSDASRLPRFSFATPQGKTNVTFGVTVGCEYNIATRVTLPMPGNLDLSFRFPSRIFDVIRKFVHQDVTEVYLEMTTDKQLNWSIDMTYVDACESAVELDFTKPIQLDLKANEDVWYKVDMNAIKALNDKEIEYAIYNRSDKQVEILAEISPTCPVMVSATKNKSLAANDSLVGSLSAKMITTIYDNLLKDYPALKTVSNNLIYYVRLRANGDLTIGTDTITPMPPVDQDACENATLLDWTQTVNLSTLTTGWYKFDITDLHINKQDFQLSLNNDMDITKALYLELYLSCMEARIAKTTQVFPIGVTTRKVAYSLLTSVVGDADEIYVYIKTDAEVPVIPNADACLNAIELTWNDTLDVHAGDTTWYMLPLAEAKALGKDLTLTVTNLADQAANIYVAVSEQCPVLSYLAERKGSVPANMTLSKTLYNSELMSLADTVYFRLSSTQELSIIAAVAVEEPEAPQGCEDAILLDWTKTINLSDLKTGWYKFDISSIHTTNKDFTLSLNNDMGEKKNLGFKLYRDCNSRLLAETVQAFKVGLTTYKVPAELIGMAEGIDMLYVYLTLDAQLPCEDAILFDWNKGVYQEANKTQWYEFDITPVLEQEKQVKLTFTNHSNENAWVVAELTLSCPYVVSIPIIVPVPAGMSVDKWIDYSVFEASRLKHCYLGVTTREAAIELAATWEDARVTPSDGCLNATLVQTDSLYEHAAGTHWYKFTADLFDKEGYFSRIRVVNRSAKTVNITAGATVGCEYNIATRTSFKLPMRFDLAFAIPVWVIEQMQKFVDDDVKEFYMELTTDQPIAFSIGQDACETAIPFDWTTGHMQEALTTQWYDVNIAPVLANEQQIKLTLTNHSDQTAWVATLVSLDCPFLVAMPLAFPIPAGMSVDKIIDYSYFAATRLDQLYVGVTTDSKISITAEAQSAQASTMDKDGCAKAILLENGVRYAHPAGTSWYRVDASFFADMARLPKFRFATISGETTNVTVGATVGCDYNIATRGTISLPGGLDLALRVPSFILKAMKLFVREDVNEFYIQLTTDKDAEFSIDSATKEEILACQDASELVLSDNMAISLKADQDLWYKVDLTDLYSIKKDLEVTMATSAAKKVEVEVEVSPTCPMVASAMKELTLPSDVNVTKVITQEQIAEILKKYPDLIYYVRVRATEDVEIEIEEYIPLEGCEEAIEYQWGKDIQLNAGDDKWYKLSLVDLRGKTCDVTLTANNTSADTVKATLDLYEDCPVSADNQILSLKDLAIAPNKVMTKTVSSTELPLDIDTIYFHVEATGEVIVNLATNCFELEYQYDTIFTYDCLDTVKIWNDTVHINSILDSVYTHIEMPLLAPVQMTDSIFATISKATLSLVQGLKPNTSSSVQAIEEYYALHDADSIADIISIGWLNDTLPVPCDVTEYEMTLVVQDTCGHTLTYVHTFSVTPKASGDTTVATICYNEQPYIWHGTDYYVSGLYVDTLTSVLTGCDSIVSLDLTVLPEIKDTLIKYMMCDGDTYIWNGITYTSDTIVSVTFTSATGCDSVATLDLTVLPATQYMYDTLAVCYAQTYMWQGQERTPGDYTVTLYNQLGCDSVSFNLHLIEYPQIPETIVDTTICYGEVCVWNSDTYTVPGAYSKTFTTTNGCDSVVTLQLTILPQTETRNVNVSVCYGDNYTWNVADTTYTYGVSGCYTHVVKNQYGCDSIIYTLNLHVADAGDVITPITTTICHEELPFEWQVDTATYYLTTAGVYTHSSASGCEAVLHLNVLPKIDSTSFHETICYGEEFEWENILYKSSQFKPDTTIAVTRTLNSRLGCDSVVTMFLTINEPVYHNIDATACDSYDWHGTTYTESGTYSFNSTAANGCDSIVTLHLTINKSEINRDTIVACDTYNWHGTTYTSSGIYADTTTTAAGCAHIDSLFLTINNSYVIDTVARECGSFEWYGTTYTQSGHYEYATTTIAGCDSIVKLDLTILPAKDSTTNVLICTGDSYIWPVNGQSYTDANTYTYLGTNQHGCEITYTLNLTVAAGQLIDTTICNGPFHFQMNGIDTIFTQTGIYSIEVGQKCELTLDLTINETVRNEFAATACDMYEWNSIQYVETGNYTQTFTAANGCDSIVTLHLTIHKSEINRDTISACEYYDWNGTKYTTTGQYEFITTTANGCTRVDSLFLTITSPVHIDTTIIACESYNWNGTVYTGSGDYEQTFTSANGCDSVVTVHLTILPAPKDSIENATICSGDSLIWHNLVCKSTGTYNAFDTNQLGCDSIRYMLHLIVLDKQITRKDTAICYGECYDWNGKTYCESGDYYDTIPSQITGCDSIVILHLMVHDTIIPTIDSLTICYGDSVKWQGTYYKTTGEYVDTLSSIVTGCDSIIKLNLTVLQEILPQRTTATISYNDTYTWAHNNQTYNAPGIYKDTIQTIHGCDSVCELQLSMLPPEITYISEFICDGTEYIDPITNKQHLISSLVPVCNTWKDTVPALFGLDSVYCFEIVPVVVSDTMTNSALESIYGGSMPILTRGLMPNLATDVIKDYYANLDNDTISDVDTVYWSSTAVACDAIEHTMALIVEDECNNLIKTFHTFPVAQPTTLQETITLCYEDAPFVWDVTGKTYSETKVYKDTLKSQRTGCDSVYTTLNLTIRPENRVELDTLVCSGTRFIWREMQIAVPKVTNDSTFEKVFADADINGCDSIVVVNLKVKPSYHIDTIATACDAFTWYGQTYTSSGEYIYNTTTATGCDSIVTLHLTINKSFYKEVSATACDSYTWDVDGQTYTDSGDKYFIPTKSITAIIGIKDGKNITD